MPKRESPAAALARVAMRLPEATTGIACKGTALESTTVSVRAKAFLFVSTRTARLKLSESLAEARRLAEGDPATYDVGTSGWVKVTLDGPTVPPLDRLSRWIEESHRLFAPPASATAARKGTRRGGAA